MKDRYITSGTEILRKDYLTKVEMVRSDETRSIRQAEEIRKGKKGGGKGMERPKRSSNISEFAYFEWCSRMKVTNRE